MNSLVCRHCNESNRVSKPIMVPYIDRRSNERKIMWACDWHDSVALWPVFTRTHPAVPKDT